MGLGVTLELVVFWVIIRGKSILSSDRIQQASLFPIVSALDRSPYQISTRRTVVVALLHNCRHRSHGWGWASIDWASMPSIVFTWQESTASQGSYALLHVSFYACSSHCMAHQLLKYQNPCTLFLHHSPMLTTLS